MRILHPILFLSFILIACRDETKTNHSIPPKETTVADKPSLNPYAGVDISPMDMSYYPVDYPKLKMAKKITAPPVARVIYSRPHLQGRHIFHEVLKYDEAWRLGANEATELDLYADVIIQEKKIKAGRYTLYCIPHKENWTIVINSNIDTWGLEPDPTKDIARFIVPAVKTSSILEYFTVVFEKKETLVDMIIAWDDTEVRLPMKF